MIRKLFFLGLIAATLIGCAPQAKTTTKSKAPPVATAPKPTEPQVSLDFGHDSTIKTPKTIAGQAKSATNTTPAAPFVAKYDQKGRRMYAELKLAKHSIVNGTTYPWVLELTVSPDSHDISAASLGMTILRKTETGYLPVPTVSEWISETKVLIAGKDGTLPPKFRIVSTVAMIRKGRGAWRPTYTSLDVDRTLIGGKTIYDSQPELVGKTEGEVRKHGYFQVAVH